MKYYGLKDRNQFQSFYHWKYLSNKVDEPTKYSALLAVKDNTVVAFLGLIPFLFKGADKDYQASWICDWHIKSEYRGIGIGRELLQQAFSDGLNLCCVGGTEAAKKQFERIHLIAYAEFCSYQKVTNKQEFYLPLRKGLKKVISFYEYFTHGSKPLPRVSQLNFDFVSSKYYSSSYDNKIYQGLLRGENYIRWLSNQSFVHLQYLKITSLSNELLGILCFTKGTDTYGRSFVRIMDTYIFEIVNVLPIILGFEEFLKKQNISHSYIQLIGRKEWLEVLSLIDFQKKHEYPFWIDSKINFQREYLIQSYFDKDNQFRGLLPGI